MRHSQPGQKYGYNSFNPRICKRCDLCFLIQSLYLRVSIHASVKDATPGGQIVLVVTKVSIHASVKDATRRNLYTRRPICFNPRICKRCDSGFPFYFIHVCCFNPRICKRCDLAYSLNLLVITVSIHASVKDATNFLVNLFYCVLFQSTHL